MVQPEDVRDALRPDTVLVTVMHANNELGTLQPIAEIARLTRERRIPLHVDGVQALGKIPVDVEALGADLYSISGHKVYAPKGVGALWVRKGTRLTPITFGGHHERDRRPGTENVPGIVAFGAAAELAARDLPAETDAIDRAARPPGEPASWTAFPAPGSTARAGTACPTPPTSASTESKAKPWSLRSICAVTRFPVAPPAPAARWRLRTY